MHFSGIVDPEELKILTSVFDDVCSAAGIQPGSPDGESVAALVMRLYWNGHRTPAELKAGIEVRMKREERLELAERRCGRAGRRVTSKPEPGSPAWHAGRAAVCEYQAKYLVDRFSISIEDARSFVKRFGVARRELDRAVAEHLEMMSLDNPRRAAGKR
jgi:hypothetical protein